MIDFAPNVVNDRLSAFTRAIDAGGAAGRLVVYGGVKPSAGQSTIEIPLVEIAIPYPSLDTVGNGVLVMNEPAPTEAVNTGQATWGRIVDSDDNWVADVSVGATGSGAVIQFVGDTNIYSGGMVAVSLLVMTES